MKNTLSMLAVLALLILGGSTPANGCTTPTTVGLASRTATSITISYSATGAFHQIEFGTLGFALGNGQRSAWTSSPTFLASNLEPSTGYDFYVRDSCTDGTVSSWTPYYATSTLCGVAELPWFENFDQDQMTPQPAWPLTGPGSWPNCWPRSPTTGYGWVVNPVPFQNNFTGPNSDHSGRSQYAVCDVIGFTGTNTDATLRTPQISLGTVSSPELSFWYHMFGTGIGSLQVQVKEAGASGPWTTVKTITGQQQSSQGAAWTNEIVSLTAWANDTIFIRFKAVRNSQFTQYADIAIDDIHVRQGSGCPAPANVQVAGVTSSTATLSWLAGGGTWSQISYGTGTVSPGGGTVVTASGNPGTITGLSPNTTYQAYVRDSCSVGSSSTWIGPVSFTTDCVPVSAPYLENFDGTAWAPGAWGQPGTIQGCWDRDATTNYFWAPGPPAFPAWNTGPSGDHTPTAGGKYMYTETSTFTAGTTTILTSPAIDLAPLDTPQLSFWYHMYGADISGLTLDISTGTSWTPLWSISGQQQTSSTAAWLEAIVDLSAYADDTIKLRWTGSKTTVLTQTADIALDDVNVYEKPSCPKPSGLAVTGNTATTVTLSWSSTGVAPWQVEYGSPGFTPGSGTVVTAATNPFTVTGLNGSTPYQFYVRDTCGVSGTSQWVGPIGATTLCTQVPAPWSEDFSGTDWAQSSGVWNDPGDIGLCWNRSDTTGYYWTPRTGATPWPNTGPNSGAGGSGKYLYSNVGATSPLNTKITTPWIDLTPVDTPALYFWSHLYGSNITNLKVEINDGSGWTNLYTVLPGDQAGKASAWTENIINLYTYRDDTVRFRFTANRSNGWWAMIGLDDLSVAPAPPPTCITPSTLSVASITPTGATISFSTSSGYSQLAIGATGFTPGFATLTNPNATSPTVLTGLTSSTSYDVYVRDSCGPGLVSGWKGPLTFSTLPCPAVTANFNYSGLVLTRIFSAQGSTTGNSYAWDFGDGTGGTGSSKTHTYTSPGTYNVTLIVTNSCGSADTLTIPITVCGVLTASYTNMVAGLSAAFTAGGTGASGYYWEFGDGATGTGPNPVHSYAASGLYTATLRAYNACGDTANFSSVIVICNLPTAEWTANILWSNGSGMNVQFDAGFSIGATSYTWYFGDGTQGLSKTPTHLYAVAGLFYQVTLVVANDCGGSDTLSKSLSTVGMDDAGIPLYGLWPNPVAPGGRLMIQGLPAAASFQITDALGRIMDHAAAEPAGDRALWLEIPAHWPGGVYFLRTEETTLRFAVTP